MDTSIFLARLLGPAFLVMAVGILANRENSRALAREFLNSPALIYLAGLIALVAGLAIVLTHNVWEFRWPVIITLFGWVSLVAGLMRLVFPVAMMGVWKGIVERDEWVPAAAVVYGVLGVWLAYAGYVGL